MDLDLHPIDEPRPPKTDQPDAKGDEAAPDSAQAFVIKWTSRIREAKKKREFDFKRMKEDMEFAGGVQWPTQNDLQDERYVANITLRQVNQKVASLYARNPKATARRRERLDYFIWDGSQETLGAAMMRAQNDPMDIEAGAVIKDYLTGTQRRHLLDRVAKTLETEYQIQIDRQEPGFKTQMKQLVRRAVICGVGFVKLNFVREGRTTLNTSRSASPVTDRLAQLNALASEYEDGKIDAADPKTEQMRMLLNSVMYSISQPDELEEVNEKLVFDFPPATSIIVDPACRSLKGFIGARWIAQEYIMSVSDVNAFFETKVESGASTYGSDGRERPAGADGTTGSTEDRKIAVWEVFDKSTKTRFFICDGHKKYLLEPEEPRPCISRFWPIFTLSFNDVEVEDGLKVTIYPPSDVRLLMHAQKEWNRSRNCLRAHRIVNRPKYLTGAGWLGDEDKERLKDHEDGAVIELNSVPPGSDVGKLLTPFQPVKLDSALYDTAPLVQDTLLTTGSQEANLGPITNRGTATEATISEQSRTSSVSSNVDDLDDLLTELAQAGGEMLLREASTETIKRDVGPGAAWPEADREVFVDRLSLEIAAASTGRPNKGLEIAAFKELAPLLMQAGANPTFLVEEAVKRLDDRLDVQRAFPLMPPQISPVEQQPASPSPSNNLPGKNTNQSQTRGPAQPESNAAQPNSKPQPQSP